MCFLPKNLRLRAKVFICPYPLSWHREYTALHCKRRLMMKHLSALLILLLILMFPCFSSDEDLYRAASMGNPSDVVLAAVSTGSLFVEEEDGWNALFYAATNNADVTVLQLLLDNGFAVNQTDNQGMTPLMYCCEYNKAPSVTAFLLEKGADVQTRSPKGESVLPRQGGQRSDRPTIEGRRFCRTDQYLRTDCSPLCSLQRKRWRHPHHPHPCRSSGESERLYRKDGVIVPDGKTTG